MIWLQSEAEFALEWGVGGVEAGDTERSWVLIDRDPHRG